MPVLSGMSGLNAANILQPSYRVSPSTDAVSRIIAGPAAAPPVTITNSFTGTNGTTVTPANSGTTAFDVVNVGTGCTVAYDTTVGGAAGGASSLKVAIGGTAAAADVEWTTAFGTQSTAYGRFYIRATANPASSVRVFTAATPGGSTLCAAIYLMTDGTLLIVNSAVGNVIQTTNAVNLGAWTRVEFKLTLSATVGQGSLSLYKSPDSATATETVTSAATFNMTGPASLFSFGTGFDTKANTGPYWLDEIGVSNAAYLGPVANTSVPATAAGTVDLGGTVSATVAITAAGSVGLGGSVTATTLATAAGSIALGGTTTATVTTTASGTVALTGTTAAQARATSSGTVTLGGTATVTTPGSTAAGTLTLGGTVTASGSSTAAGPVTLTGSATTRAVVTSTGSITLSGTATASAVTTAAGIVGLTGTATGRVNATSAGAVTLSGTASGAPMASSSGGVLLGGSGTTQAPTAASGPINLGGAANGDALDTSRHTFVTATLVSRSATATLVSNGISTAALVTKPGTAKLASDGIGTATLTRITVSGGFGAGFGLAFGVGTETPNAAGDVLIAAAIGQSVLQTTS